MSTIKISQLGNLTEALANVQIPMVANVAGTLTTVKGNVGQISSFVLGNLTTADLANISSNVSVIQSQISTLTANAGAQAGAISTLTANAGAQSGLINSLDSNVGAQLGLIYTLQDDVANLTANAGAQSGAISTLTSNAASQGASISALESNISILVSNAGAQSASINDLQANVDLIFGNIESQDSSIFDIGNNVAAITSNINSINQAIVLVESDIGNLIANASAQQEQIDNLGAVDLESIESNITALFSAIGVHTGEIYDLQSNASTQQSEIIELQSNAAAQAAQIAVLGNTSAITANISILQSNVATLQTNVTTLQSNVSTLSGNITSLTANAGVQHNSILAIDANVLTLQSNVSVLQANVVSLQNGNVAMRGYVDSAISANIASLIDSAPTTLNTLNEIAAALGDDANLSVTLTNSIANVAANVSTLFANAGVQSGNITVLQSAVGSLTANAVAQQNSITVLQGNVTSLINNAAAQSQLISNVTNGTATFGNLIPSANVTYDLGSETAQWKDLWLSGNTINLGGSTISQAGGAIVFSAAPGVDIGLRNVTGWQDYANDVNIAIGDSYTIDSTMGTWGDVSNPGPGPYLDGAVPGIRYAFGVEPANPAQWSFTYDVNGFVDTITLDSVGDPIQFDDQFEFVWYPNAASTITPVYLGEASTDPIDTTDTIWNADGKELYINRDASTNIVSVTGTGWTGADVIPGGLDGRYATLKLPDDSVVFDGTSNVIASIAIGAVEDCFALSYFIVTTETSYAPIATSTSTPSYNSVTANTGTIAGNLTVGGNLTVTNDIGFIMANYQHWTSNVSTISAALNQLAERIWNIENP